MAERRTKRSEWQRRVERWRDSGLSAKEFAAETGINAGTLQFWKYKLKRLHVGRPRRRSKDLMAAIASSLVEVRPVNVGREDRFEIELSNGRRLHVPATFEPAALRTLLSILEAGS